MTTRDWRIFRENNSIIVKGDVPPPLKSWHSLESLASTLRELRYSQPTPIQMQAIPIGLENRDLLALAPTGSGKSAAFLIPVIERFRHLEPVSGIRAQYGPYGLIMAPTRELA